MVAHLFLKKLTLVILGLTLSLVVQSGVIVEQALNTVNNYGYLSNTGADNTADNFSLGSQTSLQSLKWYGSYFDPINFSTQIPSSTIDTFEINIFESISSPTVFSLSSSSVTRSELSPGEVNFYGETIYEYEVSLSGVLNAGDYLLSISNSNTAFFDWYWSDSSAVGADGIVYYRGAITVPWDVDSFGNPDGLDAAFVLSGEPVVSVPEPTTPLLLLAGMLALLLSKRKRV